MKFGVRECANIVFRAKTTTKIGSTTFKKGQPVLYIDTAKTSTLEGAATTVYAQGGRGNSRLIAWEGEKTLTFTVEDALLSPLGFSILSGAGLIKDKSENAAPVHIHKMVACTVDADNTIDVSDALLPTDFICPTAPIFITKMDPDGSLTGEIITNAKVKGGNPDTVEDAGKVLIVDDTIKGGTDETVSIDSFIIGDNKVAEEDLNKNKVEAGTAVAVDFYITRSQANVSELQIDAENFAGYFYVEADTLFRRQDTGVDMPAILTLPNVKIQSNFTFSMASSGDPSTFTFTMDALPGYTYFDKTKQVLCVIQIVEDNDSSNTEWTSVMKHDDLEKIVDVDNDADSVPNNVDEISG